MNFLPIAMNNAHQQEHKQNTHWVVTKLHDKIKIGFVYLQGLVLD